MARALALVAASLFGLAFTTTSSALDPADVTVYADQPLITQQGGSVANPFIDSSSQMRVRANLVNGGLTHPLGTSAWGQVSWGKYVFMGNYGNFFSDAQGQRVGVFDSEQKKFCQLDVDASSAYSVEMLGVGSPQQPRSRIYIEGYNGGGTPGADLGYIDADLSSHCSCASASDCGTGGSCVDGRCTAGDPARLNCRTSADCAPSAQCFSNPCAPYAQGGWRVTKFTALQLKCIAFGLPIGCTPDQLLNSPCECATNAQCGSGGSCVMGHCVAGSTHRVNCRSSADCATNRQCLAPPDLPCPGQDCRFDGIAVLDPDTVVLNNWLHNRFAAVHIGSDGNPAVVAVHILPAWKAPTALGECYDLEPVGAPAADPTRAPGDQRFMATFDITCDVSATNPLGCAPPVGLWPPTLQQPCQVGQNTCSAHCEKPSPSSGLPFVDCSADSTICSTLASQGLDLGPCV